MKIKPEHPTSTCRNCGEPIVLVDGGRRWYHQHTITDTATQHRTCGYHNDFGTLAEPIDEQS